MSAVPPEGFSKGEKQRSSLPWDESIRDAPPKKKAGPERKMQRAAAQEEKRDGALFKSFYIFPGGSQGIPKILE